jgi:hypothetical protein
MLLTGQYIAGVTAQFHINLALANLLTDPMTLALMAADKVDPAELKAAWTALAQKLAIIRAAERRPEPCRGAQTW